MRSVLLIATLISFINLLIAIDTPIIGILSEEAYCLEECFPGNHYMSFIAAAYVKFLESAGARVVPIWIAQDENYYRNILNYTNGILFPGGATHFNESGGYGSTGKIIYKLAQELNDKGIYYPLMGICLGMQLLGFVSNNGVDVRVECSSKKKTLPLYLAPGYTQSRIFEQAPKEILDILRNNNVTYNIHHKCITEETLKKNNLTETWSVVSTNKDENGKEFISTMEHKKYPFYGLQFHPGKVRYEFNSTLNIHHNLYSNEGSQYFANFFIEQCKKNNNKFPNEAVEFDSLIYNFNPIFSARNCSFFQLYMFTEDDVNSHQLK